MMIKRLAFACLSLCLSVLVAHAFWLSRDSNYNVSIASSGVTNLVTPVFSVWSPPASTATTYNGGFTSATQQSGSVVNASATARRAIIPIPGSLSHLTAAMNALATGATVTDNINGSLGTVTCAYLGTTPFACNDTTHSDLVTAGSFVQWTFNPNGIAWSQTAPSQVSALFTASTGQQSFLASSSTSITSAGTSNVFFDIGAAIINVSTDVVASGLFTIGGKITGLYAHPSGSDNGTFQHTFTVCHNGSTGCVASPTSGMFCSLSAGAPTAGCCVNAAGSGTIGGVTACTPVSPITIAPGDTISILVSCGGASCASITPIASLIWEPTTANQVPLFYSGGIAMSANVWTGLSDQGAISSTQIPYQLAPAGMTISNYGVCTVNAPPAATSRTIALQVGSGAGVLPTTPGSGPAVTFGPSTPCPGALSGTFLGGAFDTTHTLSVAAGQTLDSAWTVTGSPGSANNSKTGMAVTVP
jgi:hypothetical protein